MRFPFVCALLAFAVLPSAAEAALSPAEQTMVRTVDAEQPRTTAMLQRWVDQNSGTMNTPGVQAVRALVEPEFQQLGFKTQWIDMKAAGRAGHLVARHVGSRRGKRLLLIAHLDTVFESDSPFQRWVQNGNFAHGPGSGDDKGGIAVIVAALRAMQAAGTLRQANITVFLTGDEEDAGNPFTISRRDLIAEGKKADVALDFEDLAQKGGPAGPVDMGSIARRSAGSWTLTVTGRSAHSSGIGAPGVGYGAIYELARILDQFRRELPEDKLTYNVGLVGGGQTARLDPGQIRLEATGKTNIIAATAVARGDLRAISEDQIDRTRAKMRQIVVQSLPGAKAEITFDEGYPPMPPTQGNRALLGRLNAVNADIGLPQMGELDPAERGAGDISFVAKDVDGLVGLGPASSGSHTDKEAVDVSSIFKQAKRAAILMSRLAAERR
jgi:glutamate carboxypeptidase